MKTFERALITGASKGLGKDISLQLASRCANLVLLGRDEKSLNILREELMSQRGFSGEIDLLVVDLAESRSLESLKVFPKKVDLLINNAGLGFVNDFRKMTEKELENMIMVNVYTLTMLTHYYAKEMATQGGGQIINIASAVAFLPVPFFSSYAATKSYVLNLSIALDKEMKIHGVRVKALCPGGIKTRFHLSAGMTDQVVKDHGRLMATSHAVATAVMALIESDHSFMTPGFPNKLLGFMSRLLPRRFLALMAAKSYQKYLPH